jgi:nickel/cobalt exporter
MAPSLMLAHFGAGSRLTALLSGQLTPTEIAIGIAIAFGFGAVHALSPGHGKTLVGAYLVGSRGTPGAALWLGITTTVTHTVTVFALGAGHAWWLRSTSFSTRYIPFWERVSGVAICLVGLSACWSVRLAVWMLTTITTIP